MAIDPEDPFSGVNIDEIIDKIDFEENSKSKADSTPKGKRKVLNNLTTTKKTTKKTDKKTSNKKEVEVIEGPLNGNTIVITGESSNITISRDRMTDILKGFGARVTKAVSRKTDLLVIGEVLETGKKVEEGNKYKEAQKNNTKIVTMEEMADMIRTKTNNPDFHFNTFSFENIASKSNIKGASEDEVNSKSKDGSKESKGPKSYLKKVEKDENIKMEEIKVNKNKSESVKSKALVPSHNKENQLWATKYAPTSLDDIVGNKDTINKLTNWLKDWDDVVLGGNKKEVANYYKGINHFIYILKEEIQRQQT